MGWTTCHARQAQPEKIRAWAKVITVKMGLTKKEPLKKQAQVKRFPNSARSSNYLWNFEEKATQDLLESIS